MTPIPESMRAGEGAPRPKLAPHGTPVRPGLASFACLVLLLGALPALGLAEAPLPPVDLDGQWKFRPGTEAQWSPELATPGFDDRDWSTISVPGSWTGQGHEETTEGWYRTTVPIPAEMSGTDGHLALWVGAVFTSYEVYAGGRKLGGEGRVGTRPTVRYGRHRTFPIPAAAVTAEGELTLAFRVTRIPHSGFGGFVGAPPRLGRLDDLARRSLRDDVAKLIFAAIFWVMGAYYLLFSRGRPGSRDQAWFGALTFVLGVFVFTTSQWCYSLVESWAWFDYALAKNIEYLARYLLPALAIQFFWPFLGVRIGPLLRAYQGVHVAMALTAVATPGLRFELLSVRAWELFTLPLLVGILVLIGRRAWQGDPEARAVALGSVASVVAFAVDIASGRGWIDAPPLGLFAFSLVVFSIAISINRRFGRAHRELDELRQTLEARITERTDELRAAKETAEAASRGKTELMASVSHEIRTPMMGILGVGDLLLGTRLEAKQQRYVETVQSSARALLGVIDELLEYSKMETGRLEIRSEPFELRRLVQDVVDLLEPRAREKSLELEVTVLDDVPAFIEGDLWRLRQVLINLVGNAIKYTIEGRVALEVLPSRQQRGSPELYLRFNVRDTGIGVAEDDMPSLFDAFTRAKGHSEQRFEGTGLGLAISRRIVDAMGGQIGADSQVGLGSSFWFEIPTRAVGSTNARVTRLRSESGTIRGISRERLLAGDEHPPAAPQTTGDLDFLEPTEKIEALGVSRLVAGGAEGLQSRRRARVLLAEDNAINRLVMLGQLESLGVTAKTVVNGRLALEELLENPYDLVLMDCGMPELDGYEASRAIRDHERTDGLPERADLPGGPRERLPIVAVTAHAMAGERERCLAAGMDDYLVKPFQLEQLEEILLSWLPRLPEAPPAETIAPGEAALSSEEALSSGEPLSPEEAGAPVEIARSGDRAAAESLPTGDGDDSDRRS